MTQPNVKAYLRASIKKQDEVAKDRINIFVESLATKATSWYSDNISGTTADRPELERLLTDSHEGDLIVVESLDRLTGLVIVTEKPFN
ncbi:recombinase family protein [Colwellia sp. BRX8-7]|jgi:DNA invertase Pin-like site-specific DNA recombinase|uniref:recombinase family protein n=1 Tax=Colwellia sp. BRX8-7 TaxID=2759833 RepID=UPI0015F39D25|nr:recombinase family protein [Colwellia sp. BRX8-7]MBA6337145.1 recombinase family protein [Colwellia sp. BRX8-7]